MEEDINVNVVTGDSATKKKVVIINSDPSDSSKIENDKIMVFAGDPSKTGNETFQKRVIIKKDGEQSESSNSTVEKNVIVNIVGTHPMSGDIPNLAPPLDIAHSMIGLLLKSPTPLEVSYIGDGENGTADALSLKSKDGKSSVLYLDKATHFPVALNYSASEETMMFRVKKDGKISQEEAKALAKSTKSQEKQDITIRFSDRRLVDGVLLPYHITRTVNGQLKDEYQIEKYDLNPDFKVIELHKSK
jgi:hypothetical protein